MGRAGDPDIFKYIVVLCGRRIGQRHFTEEKVLD